MYTTLTGYILTVRRGGADPKVAKLVWYDVVADWVGLVGYLDSHCGEMTLVSSVRARAYLDFPGGWRWHGVRHE